MPIKFFDAHTHANLAAFKDDYKEVINRALEKGVGIVNAGADRESSLRAVEIAREFPDEPIFATVGLHPDDASSDSPTGEFDYEFYKELALNPKVVGIGECGLDYFRLEGDVEGKKKRQKDIFLKQIELAKEVKKPLVIHCREAFPDLIDVLTENSSQLMVLPGIIHFMSGTKDEAKKLLELGFYFTFGGVITFVRDYDEVVKSIPMDRILSETDAPYVTPVPYRGKRNEPAYVIEVVKRLAELRGLPMEEMEEQILKNTEIAFRMEIH